MSTSAKQVDPSDVLRVAVVSDIHAYQDRNEKPEPSWLCTDQPEDAPSKHPIAGLYDLIQRESLKTDALICCGDMSNRANPGGLKYVWTKLQELKGRLKAEKLFATPGNHDVDSRQQYNNFDAKGFLQSLVPPFPFSTDDLNDRFWSRHFVILDDDRYRVLILNSSAYHGYRKDGVPAEYSYGRISPHTLDGIRTELSSRETKRAINILLCHHHPHKHGDIEIDDYSAMEGAHSLLQELDSGKYGNWIVIHGHKHHPRLCYASGGVSSPIIFSAGSLSARLPPEAQGRARNQFYIVSFPLPIIAERALGLVGTFQSWDWTQGVGWEPARDNSGLPKHGGFGLRMSKENLARQVHEFWKSSGAQFMDWRRVIEKIPEIQFLLPSDLESLFRILESDFAMGRVPDDQIPPAQIGKLS